MNRESNKYINEVGEVLNATEMLSFVKSEAKRQLEECSGKKFESLTADEQQECIIDQFKWQLEARGWKVI